MTIAEAIARLYSLKVDTTTKDGDGAPHEKPHKPLLLLAAMDLIDEGLASPDYIPWCQELRDRLHPLNSKSAIFLAPLPLFSTFTNNTRAVPLVHKENAHKGRVFFCPDSREPPEGATR